MEARAKKTKRMDLTKTINFMIEKRADLTMSN